MFNRKGEITRERRVNGPIVIVVLSFLTFAIGLGILVAEIASTHVHTHTHTEECWDD